MSTQQHHAVDAHGTNVPEKWQQRRVSEMGDVFAGKALNAKGAGPMRPYLRTKNVFDGRIDIRDVLRMPMTEAEFNRFRILRGDVLLNEGQSLELVGRCSLYNNEFNFPCAMQNQLLRFRAHAKTSPEYSAHLFRYCQQTGKFAAIATQTTSVAHLGSSRFSNLQLIWPTLLSEQRQIAEVLTNIDELISVFERSIVKKQAIKQGMMQQLLTGKIRLPGFTEPWRKFDFEELALLVKERVDPKAVASHTQLVELEHVESGSGRIVSVSTASAAVSLKSVFREGDVLFGKLRSYLRKYWLADSPGLCSTEIWVLRAKGKNLGSFVRYVVESDQFIEGTSGGYGTHMPRADWNVVRKLPVLTPPSNEQQAIAKVLQDADREITTLRDRLEKARNMKQGMMRELLTGRTRLPISDASS